MGWNDLEGFWKSTPRQIIALAEIKTAHAAAADERAALAEYREGDT